MAAEIIRLWGTADKFEIEFDKNPSTGLWDVTIPADLEDGHYVVELFAMNEYNETGYWTGVLFMYQGRPHIHIKPPRFVIWSKPICNCVLLPPNWHISVVKRCKNGTY